MDSNKFKMDWWRWGNSNQIFSLKNKPGISLYTKEVLNTEIHDKQFEKKIKDIKLPASTLPETIKNKFILLLGHDKCHFDQHERITHALGKSYYDMLKIRSSTIKYAPDLILYPTTVGQIQEIIQVCNENKIAIIPFGGGSSVVGGIDSRKGNNNYSCCLDLSLMNKVLNIDKESMLAEIEAGIFGPELEEKLNKEGFTLGHFPQSFEFSTLGGWIATRSSGQNSILYGGIEKLVNSMSIVNPRGVLKTFNTPRMAVGPNMNEILLGSEGRFGIISSATMKVKPIPKEKKYILYIFPDFDTARNACRELAQSNLHPAMIRVSDEYETHALLTMSKSKESMIKNIKKVFVKNYLKYKKIGPKKMSALMLGLEGTKKENSKLYSEINKAFKQKGAISTGTSAGNKWLQDRFFLPYIRDILLNNDILLDTLETATSWSNLQNLYDSVQSSLRAYFKENNNNASILTHISHSYSDGASLYFTIIAKQDKIDPIKQWENMKQIANNSIKNAQGAISHHHGVGVDHKNFTPWDKLSSKILHNISDELDSPKIMNPEKLFQ